MWVLYFIAPIQCFSNDDNFLPKVEIIVTFSIFSFFIFIFIAILIFFVINCLFKSNKKFFCNSVLVLFIGGGLDGWNRNKICRGSVAYLVKIVNINAGTGLKTGQQRLC